ncbi:MAG TPA: hypothetical protein V6C85_33620 [Allocoleopsis sp.]
MENSLVFSAIAGKAKTMLVDSVLKQHLQNVKACLSHQIQMSSSR